MPIFAVRMACVPYHRDNTNPVVKTSILIMTMGTVTAYTVSGS